MGSKPHTDRSKHTVWEPGQEVVLAVLEGRLAGRYRAAVVGSDRQALYLCISLPDERDTLPQGSRVRVCLTTEDGKTHGFDSHLAAAGPGLSACLAVAWPAAAGQPERRQHLRQGLVLPTVVEQLQQPNETHAGAAGRLPGVLYDLSQGGASVRCRGLQAREGDRLRLTLRLPGSGEPFQVHGQVKWVNAEDGLVGVQFLDVPPKLSGELRRLVEIRQRNLARAVGARLRGIAPEDIWPRQVQ
ncbi:MAG: PilZ domain-containing protein [Bacillota bacterium]|nr:PilZ domain-containing protein [Bacillota bacterium]